MSNEVKTNAMRLFDSAHKPYTPHHYGDSEEFHTAVEVAQICGVETERLFKTLVTKGASGENYVFVIPGSCDLHLKKAAKAVREKNIEMLPLKDLTKTTGYIKGGCSPFCMKKQFVTVFDETVEMFDTIFVSGGKRGCQIEAAPNDMIELCNGKTADIIC